MNEASSSADTETPRPPKRVFHFWRCFWLAFLVVSLAFAWYSFYVPPNDIVWAKDHDAAQQQAAESGKPMILYFTGTWCVPCRIMKRQVWADKEVAALVNANFIPVAIDVDAPDNAAIMAQYQVTGPPVTIVTDPAGKALNWKAGGVGKAEFLELLDGAK
ncbi:thioredoxin family protein [Bremerella cremea]|uniref:thioredoxin family protein n=1 Tax=Bremerella cremea TaxID=1031537 RepID=UPI0031E72A35